MPIYWINGLICLLFSLPIYSNIKKSEAMLLGSLYGDALGGPLEFSKRKKNSLYFQAYKKGKSPFAAWTDFAEPGSITDDSRHKIIFFNTIKKYKKISKSNIARSYIDYSKVKDKYFPLRKKWLNEYSQAASWVLDLKTRHKKPPETLFNSVANVSGQMFFIPLAAFYPNQPLQTYLKCFESNWLDQSGAKDFNCMIIAGISSLLKERSSMHDYIKTIKSIDPFKLNNSIYTKRKISFFLDQILTLVSKNYSSRKNRKELKRILNIQYGWEDHVAFSIVTFYLLKYPKHPQRAINEIIEFKWDTDTYLQLACAIIGAIHGKDFFPIKERNLLIQNLKKDYDLSFEDWLLLLPGKSDF